MIEIASEPTTTYGVDLFRRATEDPITTGNNGKIHGASTVSTPARNEIMSSVIAVTEFALTVRLLREFRSTLQFDSPAR